MTDDLERRQKHQTAERQAKERANDARQERQRTHREWLENSRVVNRAREQEQKYQNRLDEYERKRQDSLSDQAQKYAVSQDEQEEIAHRETMLTLMGAYIYRQNRDVDLDYLIGSKNIEVQAHGLISEMETKNRSAIDNNEARNERRKIREHTRAYITERLTDFYLAEASKVTAQRNIECTIEAETNANIREKWAENDIRKDFELFMVELRKQTNSLEIEELAETMRIIQNSKIAE